MSPRRTLLPVAAVLLAAALAPTPVVADETQRAESSGPRIRIGTYNIQSAVSVSSFKDAINAFKPQVDVAGLQEIGANEKNDHLRADRGWGYYRPPALQQNPVIWRRDVFRLVATDGAKIADAHFIGNELPGQGPTKDASWATVVRLVHRATGHQISVVNVHLVHGANARGRPHPDRPKVAALYAEQGKGTVRTVKAERQKSDRVYLLGDFNASYERDEARRHPDLPYRRYTAINMTSMWKGSPYLDKPFGTHDVSLIDQVWTTGRAQATRIDRTIRQSDHLPAMATYALPAPADSYVPAQGAVGFTRAALSATERNRPFQVREPVRFELTGDLRDGHVEVRVVDGSAREGVDFTADTSSLYDSDRSNNHVAVYLIPNTRREQDKTFTLRLENPVNATVVHGSGQVAGTIVDDD